MALFNYATKEITLKIVYYGPGLCGKTTNLQYLHTTMDPQKKSKLLSLSTESDRTLFFDFMPIALGKIKDFDIKFQLYTVPGQVRYNATRKLVLKGADAIVFVADSQRAMKDANIDSIQNMKENLIANGINPEDIPVVLQYNKRDLGDLLSVEELDRDLNSEGDRFIEAAAINGMGVEETFKMVTGRLLKHISRKHNVHIEVPEEEAAEAAPSDARFLVDSETTTATPSAPESVVNISVQDKASTELNEAEIEESILSTSFPEAPPEAEPESDSFYGAASDHSHEPLSLESIFEAEAAESAMEEEIPSLQSITEEEPSGTPLPEPSPQAPHEAPPEDMPEGEGPSDLLRLILEELRQSRKQQAAILAALERMGRDS
jgi:small GTP-binding protein